MNSPTWDMKSPKIKKTAPMPRVKATPIKKPSLEDETLFLVYSSRLRTVRT